MAGLGRGLGSLIPQKTTINNASSRVDSAYSEDISDNDRVLKLKPSEINANSRQPRKDFDNEAMNDLVASIKEHGILQPIIVTKVNNGYELIAGERRLRAAKLAKLDYVPAVLKESTSEQNKLELALIENIQREDLNAVELAMAYKELIKEFNLTHDELGKKVGKGRSTVTNILRILNLPNDVQSLIAAGKISRAHASLLAGIEDEEKMRQFLNKVLTEKIGYNRSSSEIRKTISSKQPKIKTSYADKDKEAKLIHFFNTKVRILRKINGGQVIIDFFSDEELDDIIKKII